jgi:hypothetical protein
MSELNFMHENISGIYNYCDRWCEKCFYTNRCLLFKREAELEIRYILRDENSNNHDVTRDFDAEDMQEDLDFLSQRGEEKDNCEFFDAEDYDEDYDEDEDEEFENFLEEEYTADINQKSFNPLIHLSEELFKELDNYNDVVKTYFPSEVEKYDNENPIIKNLQTLGWYVPQISVKIRMCFWGKRQLEKAKSKLSEEIEEEMLNVSSRIVYLGIKNSISALNALRLLSSEMETETVLFISTLKIIKQMFLEEFPKAETYKRPYFD